MVMELIRDNRKIVDRITHDHIDAFIELLKQDKNYRYLDLLSVLCVCDGVSIADNQKYITEVWLTKGLVCGGLFLFCFSKKKIQAVFALSLWVMALSRLSMCKNLKIGNRHTLATAGVTLVFFCHNK